MTDILLSAVLSQMTAGESIDETVAFDSYQASDGWTCKYAFRGMSAFEVDADTNADLDSFDLKYSWIETGKLEPGIYAYSGFVLSGNSRIEVDTGTISIKANPSKKTHAQKILEAIRAVMENRATADQLTISFADVQLQYMTIEELTKWETMYLGRVQREISKMSSNRDGPALGILSTRFTR